MKAIDWILVGVLLVVVGAALHHIVKGKKSGCCSAGCNGRCAGCTMDCNGRKKE